MGRMTQREREGKDQIIEVLGQNGYKTYSELFSLFDLHLTKDPEVIGYMVPGKALITINENLDIDQVSMVVRHEILHEFLEHARRAKAMGVEPGGPDHRLLNISGDYEISNRGYTEKDKENARRIRLGDQVLSGLVTEDKYPQLADKSFEEIYQALKKESPESLSDPKTQNPQIGDRGNQQTQEAEDIERRAQMAKEKAEEQEEQAKDEEKSASDETGGSKSKQNSDSGSGEGGEDETSEKEDQGKGSTQDEGGHKKGSRYDDDEYKNMSPEEKKKERARRRKEAAKKLKEAADKIMDEARDILGKDDKGKPDPNQEVFDTPEEQAETEKRIEEIKKFLENLEKAQEAIDESSENILKEKAEKEAKDVQRYRNDPLTKFKESLNKFIKDEVGYNDRDEWSKLNKTYVYSGILKPGQALTRAPVPLLNVYFDRSASWDSAKTAKGQQAIATLNKYVRTGQLKIKLYYFSEGVHSDEASAVAEGGTSGQPILDHIQQTKPNNVVIMTDSDIRDCRSDITLPGGLWLLFMGGRSQNLINHIHGKKLNKIFDLERY